MARIVRRGDFSFIIRMKSGKEEEYSLSEFDYANPQVGDEVTITRDEDENDHVSLKAAASPDEAHGEQRSEENPPAPESAPSEMKIPEKVEAEVRPAQPQQSAQVPGSNQAAPEAPKTGKKKGHRGLVIALVVVVAFIVIAAIVGGGSGSSSSGGDQANEQQAFNPDDYQQIDYATLSQRPDDYKGQKLFIKGQVVQSDESGNPYVLRVATSVDGYSDIVWVEIDPSLLNGSHITENQYVGIYGTCMGQQTYTSTMGASISIPGITADKVDTNVKSPQQEQTEKITALFNNVNFNKTDDGYGYYTYSATVANTTDTSYKDVTLILGLYDQNGTRVQETYATVSSWAAGESVVFEASSDVNAAQVRPTVEYFTVGDQFYSGV